MNLHGRGIHQQQHGRDERRQTTCQNARTRGVHIAWTLVVQHETDSVSASFDGGIHIGFTGQAADFDARAVCRRGKHPESMGLSRPAGFEVWIVAKKRSDAQTLSAKPAIRWATSPSPAHAPASST